MFYFLGQFGDHLPRNISKAVEILNELASKGSSVGQQVVTFGSKYWLIAALNWLLVYCFQFFFHVLLARFYCYIYMCIIVVTNFCYVTVNNDIF